MKASPNEIATYICNMVKSEKKSKDYALSIVAWYTMTDSEQKKVEEIIGEIF
jgi:hypothetical protein